MITDNSPVLLTHSGKFHCDDAFAYAVLRLAMGLTAPGVDHTLVRTRKPEPMQTADIVWDVGSIYDVAHNRFDHHQRGAPLRADGTPFSSAGLIWQEYGVRAMAALLPPGSDAMAATIAGELDTVLVRRIDEIDNGVSVSGPVRDDALGFTSLVGAFNPTWDSRDSDGPGAGDVAFIEASAFAEGVLRRWAGSMRARLAAEAIVVAAQAAGEDPRILVLDRGMPWKSAVFTHDLPVVYCVSPASNGNWMVDTMPPDPNSFAQRHPLPEAWAGLQEADLVAATGVADAVFVHLRRFVASARSREGALALARLALATAG